MGRPPTRPGRQTLRLEDPKTLRVAVRLQPVRAPFGPNTAPLVTTKRHARRDVEVRVDPDTPSLQLLRHLRRPSDIRAPDGGTQPHLRVVRLLDHVLFVAPFQHREDRSERLLGHDAGILRRVVDNGGCDEVTFLVLGHFPAKSRFPALLGNVVEEGLDFVVLHAVLNGSKEDVILEAIAGLEGLGVFY